MKEKMTMKETFSNSRSLFKIFEGCSVYFSFEAQAQGLGKPWAYSWTDNKGPVMPLRLLN